MKKRSVLLVAAFAFLAFAIPAQAQTTLYIGAGGSFPTSDFGDYYSTGWMGVGGVIFGMGDSGFGVGGELFYGQNTGKDDTLLANTTTTPYGVMAIADYTFGAPDALQPYLFGGLGLLAHRFSGDNVETDTSSQFGYQFGAGLAFPFGLFIEGRYMGSEDTKYFGALAGWGFGL